MSIRLKQNLHHMLMGRTPDETRAVVDARGLVVTSLRARRSEIVRCAVGLLELDPSINQQAADAYPHDFVILGPLGVAAYRATWMEELDAAGQRMRRIADDP